MTWDDKIKDVSKQVDGTLEWNDLSVLERDIVNFAVEVINGYLDPNKRRTVRGRSVINHINWKVAQRFKTHVHPKWKLFELQRDWFVRLPFDTHNIWLGFECGSKKIIHYEFIGLQMPDVPVE